MRTFLSLAFLLLAAAAFADGPADNNPLTVRRLPKLGIEVPAKWRPALETELAKLEAAITKLNERSDTKTHRLLPDVQIFHKAVHDALKYQEFHDPNELTEALKQLAVGQERAEQLLKGEAPWTTQAGLVVRGYVSKIDGSVQPYGMVVPDTYTDKTPVGYRCDVWLHGRGETMTELNFIRDRMASAGTFTPPRTLVLHPYGRWNNAFKFAGEVDVFEALASAKQRYAIDDDRVAIRGFSMGGAGAWHLAVHYPDQWFAANPGAGFSETPDFLKVFQKEDLSGKPWWEERLWLMYDCNQWAGNIKMVPTVAYSGEEDTQKQAADVMEKAAASQSLTLTHVIGPKTKHSYETDAKRRVDSTLATIDRGQHRWDRVADPLVFTTYTLRYNACEWLQIDALQAHWQKGSVAANLSQSRTRAGWHIYVDTSGVDGLTLKIPPTMVRWGGQTVVPVIIDETVINARRESDGSCQIALEKTDRKWQVATADDKTLRKKHGLQGPIDDAFMDSFLMVRPSGKGAHEAVEKWTVSECDRAAEQWRRHFRGEARVKQDSEVTDDDIKRHNLVLWGDPSSNAILAKIADKLPIAWGKEKIVVEKHGEFPAATHAAIAIYPNPLNPEKYVVLNSGFTFREYAHLNNARQVPMLPDWAIVDLTTPPGNVWPGKIVAADFFDERWKLKKTEKP